MTRLAVPKTYKLYIGGKFPRSESGRTYEVVSSKGAFLANAAKVSRKDARDAVVAARAAQAGWSSATGYNRGQVLYRIAELLEGRRAQFVEEVVEQVDMPIGIRHLGCRGCHIRGERGRDMRSHMGDADQKRRGAAAKTIKIHRQVR